jgi:hypothetical protein
MCTEPPEEELENKRFLEGYRRKWPFDEGLLVESRAANPYGAALGDAFRAVRQQPDWRVRAAVLWLLWCQHFVMDLTEPLSERHVLRRGGAAVVDAGRRDLPRPVEEPKSGSALGDRQIEQIYGSRSRGLVEEDM